MNTINTTHPVGLKPLQTGNTQTTETSVVDLVEIASDTRDKDANIIIVGMPDPNGDYPTYQSVLDKLAEDRRGALTYEEYRSGERRFETDEDRRLASLSLEQLKTAREKYLRNHNTTIDLSKVDEQFFRISEALTNKMLESSYEIKAADNLMAVMMMWFEEALVAEHPEISADSYSIVQSGSELKVRANGNNPISKEGLQHIQRLLDEEDSQSGAALVVSAIENYKRASQKGLDQYFHYVSNEALGREDLSGKVNLEEAIDGYNFSKSAINVFDYGTTYYSAAGLAYDNVKRGVDVYV